MDLIATRPREKRAAWWRVSFKGHWLPYLFVLPTILLILLIAVYPMLDSLRLSLLDNPLLSAPHFVGLRNYSDVLSDPIFIGSMQMTLLFTILSVAAETLFGLSIALLINHAFPGRGLVRAAILIPWAFPTVVSAQIWLLMYNDQTGVITYLLQSLHLLPPGNTLLGTPAGVLTAAVITDVWKTTPFMTLLLLAGLQVIPDELYEAANVDGTTRWQRFTTITLPLLWAPLLIALLFRSLDSIRVFDLFYVFGQRAVPSMASYANFKMFAGTAFDFAPGVAAAVMVFLYGLAISLFFVVLLRRANR
ncbi:carbohydrate ABC transporter permease [Tengunoibacter tsumagoiensis]|uniref:ABC transporter permease n=1 Tax=Tengunoibacter tsumagoiensis TaxID=2014871 RepID=A0A401ZTU7_9CHLR|nr:sugar ABC transporter permease [Tengunoibacter tsumagoiensis]GCE10291.1 ABC transporter permease [Tengunoibacter tsumagoiensis]